MTMVKATAQTLPSTLQLCSMAEYMADNLQDKLRRLAGDQDKTSEGYLLNKVHVMGVMRGVYDLINFYRKDCTNVPATPSDSSGRKPGEPESQG
jgi:hypothetical protein